MPIGSRCWRWFEPRLRSGSTGMKAGLAALFVCAAFVYVFLGPLVFDASYWVLGKAARVQADRRLRVGVSVAFVAESMAAWLPGGDPERLGPGWWRATRAGARGGCDRYAIRWG